MDTCTSMADSVRNWRSQRRHTNSIRPERGNAQAAGGLSRRWTSRTTRRTGSTSGQVRGQAQAQAQTHISKCTLEAWENHSVIADSCCLPASGAFVPCSYRYCCRCYISTASYNNDWRHNCDSSPPFIYPAAAAAAVAARATALGQPVSISNLASRLLPVEPPVCSARSCPLSSSR